MPIGGGGGGGGSQPFTNVPATKLDLVATTVPDSTWTLVPIKLNGADPIGITKTDGSPLGAGATELQMPAGWYVATLNLYWNASATGLRGVTFQRLGFFNEAVPEANLPAGMICTAAEYVILEQLTGMTLGPFPFGAFTLDGSDLEVRVWQSSGGDLDIFPGYSITVQKIA